MTTAPSTRVLLEWQHPTQWSWTAGIYKISNHSNDTTQVFVLESGDDEGHDCTYLAHRSTLEEVQDIAQALQDVLDGATSASDALLSNLEAIVATIAQRAASLEERALSARVTTLTWRLDGGWETTNGAPWFFMVPYGSNGNIKAHLTKDIDLGTTDNDEAKDILQNVQDALDRVPTTPQAIVFALEKEIESLSTYLPFDPAELNEETLSEINGLQNAIAIVHTLEARRNRQAAKVSS